MDENQAERNLAKASRELTEAKELVSERRMARDKAAREAYEAGLTYARIAKITGLSRPSAKATITGIWHPNKPN